MLPSLSLTECLPFFQAYNFTGTLPHGPTNPVGGGGGEPVFPVGNSSLPASWEYASCYV